MGMLMEFTQAQDMNRKHRVINNGLIKARAVCAETRTHGSYGSDVWQQTSLTRLERLLTGKLDLFERDLRRILEETASYNDMAQEPEAFYHGFMMGLTISVHYDPRYELHSNKESGYGRYDYLIFSKDKNRPTILLEFKRVDVKEQEKLETSLTRAAEDALAQIDQQGYLAQAQQRQAGQILKIGLAFCGKRFALVHQIF
jgi:hypothetical protein